MAAPHYWLKKIADFTTVGGTYSPVTPVHNTMSVLNPTRTISGIQLHAHPTTTGFAEKDVSAQSYVSGWCGFEWDSNNDGTDTILPIFELEGDLGTPLMKITKGTAAYSIRCQRWDGSAWQQFGSDYTTVLLNGSPRIDVNWTIDDVTGKYDVYINGSVIAQFSGDTLTTSDTTIDIIRWSMNSNGNGSNTTFGGVVIDGSDTRSLKMHELVPNAAGHNSDTGGTYTAVDAYFASIGADGFLTFDTLNEAHDVGTADFVGSITDSYTVEALSLIVTAKAVADPGFNLEGYVSLSSVDYTDNVAVQVNGATNNVYEISMNTDPQTATAWANPSAVDAKTFGVKAVTPT